MNKYLLEAQALAQAGQFADAAELCRKAIKLRKDVPAAQRLLAHCLYDQGTMQAVYGGMLDAAEDSFRQALAANPAHVNAHCSLASVLQLKHRYAEAIDLLQRALKLEPGHVLALENLAKVLLNAERLDEAAPILRKLAQLLPEDAAAFLLREALLVHKIVPDADYPARVRAAIDARLNMLASGNARLTHPLRLPASYFPLSYHGLCNKELVQRIAAQHLRAMPELAWSAPHVARWTPPAGRKRIGIASAYLRAHSIGNTARGLVEQLDRAAFEVIVIRLGPSNGDALAQHIDRSADRVVTVPYDDLPAAREAIAALELDILFYQDIGMEPLSYLLAFSRLAPVQCTSFGHPDTTGIPNLDYFISSAYYETPDAHADYSERLVQLPAAGTLSYYHRPPLPPPRPRTDFGLRDEDRIYLCPQTLFKIQPAMDAIFKDLLEQDPQARIVLIDPGQEELRPALERRLAGTLGPLMERCIFISALPYDAFLALLRCADVVLDTVHFNGQNTSLEAFALGVPVVTLPGRLQRARHTYGMYRAMDFMELVATDTADYVRLALRLARDSDYREHCRARIAQACGVLFENLAFVRHCEAAFAAMLTERTQVLSSRA